MKWFEDNASRWISIGGGDFAPYFFATFECGKIEGVRVAICGLGYYELVVNGRKVGDLELTPHVSVYDRRARYNVYDLSPYLREGLNAAGVILGNGWYNHDVKCTWNYEYASWRHHPKLRCEIRDRDGALLLGSDASWLVSADGPIIYNHLRSGERYDARREFADWATTEFKPDGGWRRAAVTAPPGGLLVEEEATPCRVVRTFCIAGEANLFGVYELEESVAGRCRVTVRSREPGSRVILDYAERVTDDGGLSKHAQDRHVVGAEFQHEEYILRGDGRSEVWESRFTFHGFCYVRVQFVGEVELEKIEVRQISSDFASVGSFQCSSADLNRLQSLTRISYLGNFVGFPTDCPHREKNGWTGDAQLACETGLYNFDSARGYGEWLESLRDYQRMNGQLPAYVPCVGKSFNWGNGPNWDGALFVIPYEIWRFTGDDSVLKDSYAAMRRYLDFCETVMVDGVVAYGLGDWCPPVNTPTADPYYTTTATFYGLLGIFVKAAEHFGRLDDAREFKERAERARTIFNRRFYKGDGIYENGGLTALAAPVYHGLCEDGERPAVIARLVELARRDGCKANFGILGAKYVPRVLADNGYANLALEFFTQDSYPGWTNWVRLGVKSLWEQWEGHTSRNHIMFGDLSAWLFRYAAGFRHSDRHPGWRRIAIEPSDLTALENVRARYRGYGVEWSRREEGLELEVAVPEGCVAEVTPPGGRMRLCGSGVHKFPLK